MEKLGLGGGCHWCTEGVFASLIGITKVKQGWIAAVPPHDYLSEGVVVHFNSNEINLETLIAIHLETHAATSEHSFRKKYRSAIYVFSEEQKIEAAQILKKLQKDYKDNLITHILKFKSFKENDEKFLNYYYTKPEAPFCRN